MPMKQGTRPIVQLHPPAYLPHDWRVIDSGLDYYQISGMNAYSRNHLTISVHHTIETDGKLWKRIMITVSDTATTPSYADVQCARELCVAPDEHAYMVWPCKRYDVIAPFNSLFLHVPINHRPLPDFRPDQRRNRL